MLNVARCLARGGLYHGPCPAEPSRQGIEANGLVNNQRQLILQLIVELSVMGLVKFVSAPDRLNGVLGNKKNKKAGVVQPFRDCLPKVLARANDISSKTTPRANRGDWRRFARSPCPHSNGKEMPCAIGGASLSGCDRITDAA